MDNSDSENQSTEIPDSVIETLARCLFPKLVAFFESPEGQAEFAAWQQHQNTST